MKNANVEQAPMKKRMTGIKKESSISIISFDEKTNIINRTALTSHETNAVVKFLMIDFMFFILKSALSYKVNIQKKLSFSK
jgi:hypothetical protein